MLNSATDRFSQWIPLNRHVSKSIRRLYMQQESPIGTAVEILKSHIFDTDFKYDWCPDVLEPTYDRTMGALINAIGKDKKGNTVGSTRKGKERTRDNGKSESCDSTPQDPDQIMWMKKTMMGALDYYFMFGMCPFRMIIGPDMNPKILIPAFESGNFIARIDENSDIVDVRWQSYRGKVNTTGRLEPDPKVGVFLWDQYAPMLDEPNPFTSTMARVRRDYIEMRLFMQNYKLADSLASNPPIVTVSTDKIRSVDGMSWDQALGDSIAFDPDNQTVDESERQRINDSSFYQSTRIADRRRDESTRTGRGSVRLQIFDDGNEVYEFCTNPWFGSEYEIPNGRTTASYAIPRPNGDLIKWKDWWEKKASEALRVPIELMKGSSGNKSATEAETSNRIFRSAVSNARDAITEFMEEAWAQGMGKFEERLILEGIESIMHERAKLMTDRESRIFSGDKQGFDIVEALKNDRPITAKELSERQTDRWMKGQPLGAITPEEKKRARKESEIANKVEALYGNLMRKAQAQGVPVEPWTMYKNIEEIIRTREEFPEQNENTMYNDILERESKKRKSAMLTEAGDISPEHTEEGRRKGKRQKERANVFMSYHPGFSEDRELQLAYEFLKSDDAKKKVIDAPSEELDPNMVATELMERRNLLDNKERSLRSALKSRKRLKLFWMMPPVMDPADIVFLMDKGAIDREVGNAMLKSKTKLALDTPSGVPLEVYLMQEKAKLDQKTQARNQEFDMKKIKEQQKFQKAQLKETEKIRAAQQQQKQQQMPAGAGGGAPTSTTGTAPASNRGGGGGGAGKKKQSAAERSLKTKEK